MLLALTRGVSPNLNRCEVSYLPRQPIDVALAAEQHRQYEAALRERGITVISLPAQPDLPDCMFVEDPAVVVDEVAVMTRMGAESRRGESQSLAAALAPYRPLRWMREPATLEGGDVLGVGSQLFVGLSARTNRPGIEQLAAELQPFGYSVTPVEVRGCLHLKSACCALDSKTVLANRNWIDASPFEGFTIIDVPPDEPRAANVLALGNTVILPDAFPATASLLESRGYQVRRLNISELMKAESGVTCSSILLSDNRE
jgi:dimethylargininase